VRLRLNGVDRELPDGTTVAALLEGLGVDRAGVAVAVDAEVVPRGRHATTPLKEGAVVEVIRAVGGG
jgi:sulfur carrier protein